MESLIVCCILFPLLVASNFVINPGPKYPPSKGEVWPAPSKQTKEESYFVCNPKDLQFKIATTSCDILEKAIVRYTELIDILHKNATKGAVKSSRKRVCSDDCTGSEDKNFKGYVQEILIQLNKPCEDYPQLGMDEKYNLSVGLTSELKSDSIWGILRGLETFSQLMYISHDSNEVRITKTTIEDQPRYPHRGLLLDTSRHYISVDKILEILDGMAMNKMNVFHWHIVDDPSFPYQSKKFPELSAKGAFSPNKVYTQQDIHLIIKYARINGIRVIPEFDVPGHTASWGKAYPSILTQCFESGTPDGLGPMNPIINATYDLMKGLFQEVQNLFPDQHFHVGGDEINLNCWNSNPDLKSYLLQNNLSLVSELHKLFMKNTLSLLRDRSTPIVWQEVFDNEVAISNDTLVQVWRYGDVEEMERILKSNKKLLFSSAWYLDAYLGLHWQDFYKVDPKVRVGQVENIENIIGGEACMWTENVDEGNVVAMIWPRASAIAERLWTDNMSTEELAQNLDDIKPFVYSRFEEHTSRMIARGVGAEPSSSAKTWKKTCIFSTIYVTFQILVVYYASTNFIYLN